MLFASLLGWLDREQRYAIAFLREENRTLKAQLAGRRLRPNDAQRRRLAVLGQRLGRAALRQVATLVTPDTILRWHRELIARKWTYAMATENPTWGYTRIQGALKNVGHRVARSTIANILKAEGLPPSGERSTTWRTFLRAHWPALVAADFFTTEVWTPRGLVTYTLVRSRVAVAARPCDRLHPVSDDAFIVQAMRDLANAIDGVLADECVLICDRDRKWSCGVLEFLEHEGVRIIRTPFRAPNCNAYAERFVRSIKEECLERAA